MPSAPVLSRPPNRTARVRDFLYYASRSQSFLWKFTVAAIAAGAALGWALSLTGASESHLAAERALGRAGLAVPRDEGRVRPPAMTTPGVVDGFAAEFAREEIGFEDVIRAMPLYAAHVAAADYDQLRVVLQHRHGDERSDLAIDYLAAWAGIDDAFTRLGVRAELGEPPRYTFYVLGRLALRARDYRGAFVHFQREGARPEAFESRFFAVQALVRAKDFSTLDTLRDDARYAGEFTPWVDLHVATEQRQWGGMLKAIVRLQLASYHRSLWIVAAVAGLAWAVFLFHLGELQRGRFAVVPVCIVAFTAGALSTTLTIFFICVQEDIWGFTQGDDFARALAYFVAGVGLREELAKLILFAPLVLWLRRRNDERDALLAACFVGLGFAIEENVSYFASSAAASAPGRFLTANFFHIALTGLNGLALYRACTRGMAGVNEFLFVFPITVLAHGLYDALLDTPPVEGGEYFAMTVFVGFCMYFFRHVHAIRENVRMTVSLTGAFVFGIALLAATVIAFQMAMLGAEAGASLIFSELIGSAALLFVFFREFNEPLTA